MRPRSHRRRLLLTAAATALSLAGTSALQAAAEEDPPSRRPPARPWLQDGEVTRQHALQEAVVSSMTAATAERQRQQLAAAAVARANRSRPAVARGSSGAWHELIDRYPWDHARAHRVMMCESHGRASARNGSHNGLFQIAGGPFDPAANVAAAFRMYQGRGWQPWAASRHCWA